MRLGIPVDGTVLANDEFVKNDLLSETLPFIHALVEKKLQVS